MTLIGRQLDEYKIEKLLGQGGMGRVYAATDVRLKRRVALKVIDTPFHGDLEYRMRFEREAEAIARLEHRHIVTVYRLGEAEGLLYMAMQHVDGSDMATMLDSYESRRELIEMLEVQRIIREICTALDYAHSQGVIHRDIKPSNIMLDQQGRAYLTDFGLARLMDVVTHGSIFGSAHYMAPEQAISSAAVVPQSDLYSVGVILFEMLTGQVPFDSDVPSDIVMMQVDQAPPSLRAIRPQISVEVEGVVLRALAKKPHDRFSTGKVLSDALSDALDRTLVRSPGVQGPRAATFVERVREKTPPPLPPIPAAVAITTGEYDSVVVGDDSDKVKRGEKSRRRAPIIPLMIVFILVIAGGYFAFGQAQNDNGDRDGDGVVNVDDNCPSEQNPGQLDNDGNGIGDACQDTDNDTVVDVEDACPQDAGLVAATGCFPDGWIDAVTNVNLRDGPGMRSEVFGSLAPGRVVTLIGRNPNENWLLIQFDDPIILETEGWVSADLVNTDFEIDRLPVIE